jgi:hypothetical protein
MNTVVALLAGYFTVVSLRQEQYVWAFCLLTLLMLYLVTMTAYANPNSRISKDNVSEETEKDDDPKI